MLRRESRPALIASAHSRAADVDLAEVEMELRAQIERALNAGLRVDYLDYHMLTPTSTPEMTAIVESLDPLLHLGLGWAGPGWAGLHGADERRPG